MRLKAEIKKNIGEFSLDVSISSDANRIGILGASGSGKSMTLRCIAGIDTPDAGSISVGERVLFDSASKTNLKPQKRRVGYMFQNYALFPTMTVLQNVMAGLKGGKRENREIAMDMISRMRLDDLENRLPGELSGGQQQRVALARIMVYKPELIMLDEPFSALDQYLKDKMQREMLELLEDYEGQVIMVSHSRDELYRFSDELFVVKDGRILKSGETRDVFQNPQKLDVAKLTGCKNFSAAVRRDAHAIDLTDWGVTVHTVKDVPEWTRHIGYRAHYFEPVWGEKQENCIPFKLAHIDELPFEWNYYIYPKADEQNADDLICWFVQGETQRELREKGMPDYLKISEDNLLYLE